jgi:hypothetical protein
VVTNGTDLPGEFRDLPAGRCVVEAREDEAPALSPEQDAGTETALESCRHGPCRGRKASPQDHRRGPRALKFSTNRIQQAAMSTARSISASKAWRTCAWRVTKSSTILAV